MLSTKHFKRTGTKYDILPSKRGNLRMKSLLQNWWHTLRVSKVRIGSEPLNNKMEQQKKQNGIAYDYAALQK